MSRGWVSLFSNKPARRSTINTPGSTLANMGNAGLHKNIRNLDS